MKNALIACVFTLLMTIALYFRTKGRLKGLLRYLVIGFIIIMSSYSVYSIFKILNSKYW